VLSVVKNAGCPALVARFLRDQRGLAPQNCSRSSPVSDRGVT
jgi:hypothetical protein